MRAVLEVAGVQDVLTKNLGSNNPHNAVHATMDALRSACRTRPMVARRRGMSVGHFIGKGKKVEETHEEAANPANP